MDVRSARRVTSLDEPVVDALVREGRGERPCVTRHSDRTRVEHACDVERCDRHLPAATRRAGSSARTAGAEQLLAFEPVDGEVG